MQLIPVLELLGGQAVQSRRGNRYEPVRSRLTPDAADPLRLAAALLAAFGPRTVYLADLDAMAARGHHHAIIADLAGAGVDLLVDAGLGRAAQVPCLLGAGAARVLVRAAHLENWDELDDMIRVAGAGRVVLSSDARGPRGLMPATGLAAVEPLTLVSEAVARGVQAIMVTGAGLTGLGTEWLQRVQQLHPHTPVLCGDPVNSIHDLGWLRDAGAAGALAGTALHTGRLGPEQVRRVESGAAITPRWWVPL